MHLKFFAVTIGHYDTSVDLHNKSVHSLSTPYKGGNLPAVYQRCKPFDGNRKPAIWPQHYTAIYNLSLHNSQAYIHAITGTILLALSHCNDAYNFAFFGISLRPFLQAKRAKSGELKCQKRWGH